METSKTDKAFAEVMSQLPRWFNEWSDLVPNSMKTYITELRLFSGQSPLWMEGRNCRSFGTNVLSSQQMQDLFLYVCQGSVHSFQQEIKEGFVTLNGGHRVGLCGTAVFHNGQQSGLRDITSMNIRFARQHRDCAAPLYEKFKEHGYEKGSFLIAGAPSSGKTTLLRDYCRILSDKGIICAMLDERGELSGFDLGNCTHVLKGLPKTRAILQALRCLSPEIIFCDEIGTVEEAELLCSGLGGGAKFIGTIHGDDLHKLLHKPQLQPLLQQQSLDMLVLVEAVGKITEIMEVNSYAASGLHFDNVERIDSRHKLQNETGTGAVKMESPASLFSADSF